MVSGMTAFNLFLIIVQVYGVVNEQVLLVTQRYTIIHPSPQSDIDHIPSLHISVTTSSSSTSFPHPFISFSFFMEGWM